MQIILPAELTRFSSRADKSFGLSFSTAELTGEQILGMNAMKNHFGYLMFKDSVIEKSELDLMEDLKTIEVKRKSKSQILRQTLWKIWKNTCEDQMTDEEFYNKKMDKIIAHFEKELNQ